MKIGIEQADESEIVHKIGAVAQSVEQRTENPCVGGSIPPHTTEKPQSLRLFILSAHVNHQYLHITWINSRDTTCLTKSCGFDLRKFFSCFIPKR